MDEKRLTEDGGLTRSELLRGAAAGAFGLGVLGIAGCGSSSSSSSKSGTSTSAAAAGSPPSKPTGVARIGLPQGNLNVIADPRSVNIGYAGSARLYMINDPLAVGPETGYDPQPWLATSIEGSSDAKTWDVTLRDGVTFHDGSPLTADDVVASLQLYQVKTSAIAPIWAGVTAKKTGPLTVRFTLAQPEAIFLTKYAMNLWVLPANYDPKKPIGTGPFKFESIQPGAKTVMTANPHWWGHGPYVEQLELYEFADDAARVNALLAHQVDAIDQVPTAEIPAIKGGSGLSFQTSPGFGYTPLAMRVDTPPFSDVRARQAMRLIIDRQVVLDNVYDGLGLIGNDIMSPEDLDYIGNQLAQHTQDIPQAKSLLKAAGMENLSVVLTTSDIAAGAVELAQVFAQEAKQAGVNVQIKQLDPTVYFTPASAYGTKARPFLVSVGGTSTGYLQNVATLYGPTAEFPETGFADPQFLSLYGQALGTVDSSKQAQLVAEMQRIEYERGPYVIPVFVDNTTAYGSNLKGMAVPKVKSGLGMNGYQFQTLWVT
jgi:peptide/nickel transport system substrate-binding protein